jgi:flagellar hook-associated protein 2
LGIYDISSMLNSRMRFTGMASGLDTESIVQQLMKAENMKLDRAIQQKQLLEWKRDDYRSVTNMLRAFKDEYFDVLKPSANFRSTTLFSAFKATASDTGVLSVTAGSGASIGSFDVVVNALAKKAEKEGLSGVSRGYTGLTGKNPVDMNEMKQGKRFTVTLDGITKTITLDKDYTGYTVSEFAGDASDGLQRLLDRAFGTGRIGVTENGGSLVFTPSLSSSILSIGDSNNTYLGTLGFSSGQSNTLASNEITDFSGGNFMLSIGSGHTVEIKVESASDITTLLSNINSALEEAGVNDTVKAIEDVDSAGKIKFVTLDTAKEVKFSSSSTDNMLSKLGIKSGSTIKAMNGTINYKTNDIGMDFYIAVNGVRHRIDLENDYSDDEAFAQAIQQQLDSEGITGVTVNISEGKISFSNPFGHQIELENGDDGLRDELGFSATVNSSRISLNSKLEDLDLANAFIFNDDGNMQFSINGVSFTANKGDTLNDIIRRVNASDVGVKMRYDSLNDRFFMESASTGSSEFIDNSDDTGNFFAALNIDTSVEVRGTNASIRIGDTVVERSENKFTIEGVTYDLKATGTSTISISSDPDKLIDTIKAFVEKYNEVIGLINTELNEERFRNFMPLTDEQKKEMNENDIKLWEEKARSGLLRSDSILQKITYDMRRALYDSVEGVDLSLHEIGITTSSNHKDAGKLVINEEKLRQAIENDPEKIAQLFTKESKVEYEDISSRSVRYAEEGLAQRLYDIIQDNIRTTRDKNGKKGILLEKAGITGDVTEFNNSLSDEIKYRDQAIYELMIKLYEKEEQYYARFTAMETALARMNSQSAWIAMQFGQRSQ